MQRDSVHKTIAMLQMFTVGQNFESRDGNMRKG